LLSYTALTRVEFSAELRTVFNSEAQFGHLLAFNGTWKIQNGLLLVVGTAGGVAFFNLLICFATTNMANAMIMESIRHSPYQILNRLQLTPETSGN